MYVSSRGDRLENKRYIKLNNSIESTSRNFSQMHNHYVVVVVVFVSVFVFVVNPRVVHRAQQHHHPYCPQSVC